MKKQIKRLSPHQNGKVAAVLMAIFSLIFVLPFSGIMYLFSTMVPQEMMQNGYGHGPGFPMFSPFFSLIIFPLIYLIFAYISTALFCLAYNLLVPLIGGYEFEMEDV